MINDIAERVFSNRTTGVPRRMALGALFLLVTIFCILFRGLTLVEAPPSLIVYTGVFAVLLASGQAILFAGRRPRDASIYVGTCTLPLMVGFHIVFIDGGSEYATRILLSGLVAGLFFGPILGYLVGIFLAGGFLVFERWRSRSKTNDQIAASTSRDQMDGQIFRWMVVWRERLRHRPLHLAAIGLIVALLFGCMMAPGFAWLSPSQYAKGLLVAALVVSFLSSILQLRWRAILIPISAGFAAAFLMETASQVVYFRDYLGLRETNILAVVVVSSVTLIVLATTGWAQVALQWMTGRNVLLDTRGGLVCLLSILALATWFAASQIAAFGDLPSQKVLVEVENMGGQVSFAINPSGRPVFPPLMESLSLKGCNADEFLQDLADEEVDLSALRSVEFVNSTLTATGSSHFNGLRMRYLNLSGSKLATDVFSGVDLPVSYLILENTNLDDRAVTNLVSNQEVRRTLRTLSLASTKVTDDCLPWLSRLQSLQSLSLSACAITGSGFQRMKPVPSATQLNMHGTQLGDSQLKSIVSAFPNLQALDIRATAVTNEGIECLNGMINLHRLSVTPGQFSEERRAWLMNQVPELEVDE